MMETKNELNNIEENDFFRFNFDNPLGGSISIEEIKGTQVKSNSTHVQIKDISASGLSFESDLNFPLREDVLYSFQTKIMDKDVEIKGLLKRQESREDEKFEYGVAFNFGEKKASLEKELVQLVTCLQISSRHGRKRGYKLLESFSF